MNKIGITSWTLGIDKLPELMEKIKVLGLDGVQFSGNFRKYNPKELRALADQFEIEIFAIDPFDCEPSNSQEANAESAIEFYKQIIDFAVEAKAPRVTLHGLPKWTVNCDSHQECWEMLVHCCKILDSYAQLKKIKLVYECLNRYETKMIRTAEEGTALINDVGHGNIELILDSFHMHIEEPDPLEAIEKSSSILYSYHISDSNRSGIGSAQVDFVKHYEVLKEIGFEGPVMIEVVLPELAPTATPTTEKERERLDEEIRRSVRVWRNL